MEALAGTKYPYVQSATPTAMMNHPTTVLEIISALPVRFSVRISLSPVDLTSDPHGEADAKSRTHRAQNCVRHFWCATRHEHLNELQPAGQGRETNKNQRDSPTGNPRVNRHAQTAYPMMCSITPKAPINSPPISIVGRLPPGTTDIATRTASDANAPSLNSGCENQGCAISGLEHSHHEIKCHRAGNDGRDVDDLRCHVCNLQGPPLQ